MVLNRAAVAVVTGCALLLAACASDIKVSPPVQATATTPVASLPVNVAYQQNGAQLPTEVPQAVIDAADAEYAVLTNVYERVAPSVVNVDVIVNSSRPGVTDRVSGSGFVYDADGHIITNAHVIHDSVSVQVTFNDGYITDATVVGVDTYSDIAVLKVDTQPVHLHPVTFADSNIVRVGSRAIAIGNPFGLASSMTVGVVSGLGRQLPSQQLIDSNSVGGFNNPSIIQVDTNINPGNSGGPLLDSHGDLIGVNTAISTDTGVFGGVGFAVPSRTVQRVVPELIASGKVNYGWLGISSLSAEDGYGVAALAEPLSLPVTAGVLIDAITSGSPAAKAGLHGGTHDVVIRGERVCAGGDVIVAVNGTYVNTMDELVAYLVMNSKPGDTLKLLIVRGGQTFELPLLLEARPDNAPSPTCGS